MTTISGALNLHTMIVVISVSTLSRIHWPGYSTSPTVTSELKVVGDSQSAKVQYEP